MPSIRSSAALAVLLIAAVLLCGPATAAASDNAVVAAGAGYRALVEDLCADYAAGGGAKVDTLFGNMAQVASQARLSGKVDCIIGDASFLNRSGLTFRGQRPLGFGKLAVACSPGVLFSGPQSLLSPEVKRIALPDTKRAIYGKAAMQYLEKTGLYEQVKDKITMVATIPQAASYVMTGEVDLAFVNLTHARKIKDKIGSFALPDTNSYAPIHIVAGELTAPAHPDAIRGFLDYLSTDRAQAILQAHGL